MGKKICVVFPGIGYHTDKPLLYYSKKYMMAHGYEIVDVTYGKLSGQLPEKIQKVFDGIKHLIVLRLWISRRLRI